MLSVALVVSIPVTVSVAFHLILQQAVPAADSGTICIPWWVATAVGSTVVGAIGYLFKLLLSVWGKTDLRLDKALDRVAELEHVLRTGAVKDTRT